jgi:hypothetical protein
LTFQSILDRGAVVEEIRSLDSRAEVDLLRIVQTWVPKFPYVLYRRGQCGMDFFVEITLRYGDSRNEIWVVARFRPCAVEVLPCKSKELV